MPFAKELPGFKFYIPSNLRAFLAFKVSVQVYLLP